MGTNVADPRGSRSERHCVSSSMTTPSARVVHRIEVRPKPGIDDPRASTLQKQARTLGLEARSVRTARVYLIQASLSDAQLALVQHRLLTDPVTEAARLGAVPAPSNTQVVEIHPLPGVMDPVAQSVQDAIHDLTGTRVTVSTAQRYDVEGVSAQQADAIAKRFLANPVVQAIHAGPFHPASLPSGKDQAFALRHVPVRALDDAQLASLSRDAHLFLSLEEMRAIQSEYRRIEREPTDIELETLAQTWSEHCVHKTLKSKIRYRHEGAKPQGHETQDAIRWKGRPGHTIEPDGSITIDNLLKSTVAAATHELIAEGVDWALSVFKDNAGVIALDDTHAVCIKVETHNHPSALEPYGGAATGAGGCIRDVIGTGLAAKPIANTDVFCVALPDRWAVQAESGKATLPPGTLHPRRVLEQVVAGVRDYGNRMGIPTLNGAVAFDDRYVGNPLVFCGCIGLLPRHLIKGRVREGDRIIALGGRTGRDGIHGATFSSAELEEGHVDEFSHAVQIGNAIEEKRVLDAILRARDESNEPLFHAITDCGAGGFSSAVGEMGSELGAEVLLERAPLKYAGLSYTEIWISEAQERMVLAVPEKNLGALKRICREESVELAELGTFGTPTREIVLKFHGQEVGRLSTQFLHDGIPQPTREAVWKQGHGDIHSQSQEATRGGRGAPADWKRRSSPESITRSLLALLAHPNIASKQWIIRQYDHEVQGNTIVKPLVGERGRGPGDAAVLEPVAGTGRGISIACGLQTWIGDPAIGGDTYQMALAAIDECVRNLVCVGTDPSRIAILDNFCWPSCGKPENLGTLVRAAEGCYDGAKAFKTPFVSGKDSLNNQLKYRDPTSGAEHVIEIPPTLLITGLGIVPDVHRAVTSDAKAAGNILLLVGATNDRMGGSHWAQLQDEPNHEPLPMPSVDLALAPKIAAAVHRLIAKGLVAAAHDASDGGLLVAIAEMLIASPALGAALELERAHPDPLAAAFGEAPSRYVLEIAPGNLPQTEAMLKGVPHARIGTLTPSARLEWKSGGVNLPVEELSRAWHAPLDW